MQQGIQHTTATFFNTNNERQLTVAWHNVSHISEDVKSCKDCNKNISRHRHGGTWIHFLSGKDVHVEDDFRDISTDFEDFLNTY